MGVEGVVARQKVLVGQGALMTLKVGLVGARGVGALKCFRAMEATDASYFKDGP